MSIKLKNNTGSLSRIGYAVSIDPRDNNAFIYSTPSSTKVIGIITEQVPYRAFCNLATAGEKANVYVNGNAVKGNSIRLSKTTDRTSLGTCMIAKVGDSPYVKIGDALSNGRGLVPCLLELSHQGTDESGYVPYEGATGDVDLGTNGLTANDVTIGGATNNITIDGSGNMGFNGDATVWEDLNFDPNSSGGPAVSLPDYVTINNVIHREFTSANNQLCGDGEELPHKYKLSSQMYPHIHIFLKGGESAGTTGVSFTFYWELRQGAGTTSGSTVLSATSAQLTANPHKIDIHDNTGFAGSAELGAQLSITMARTAGNAGDVVLLTYGVHYEIDTVGSKLRLSK